MVRRRPAGILLRDGREDPAFTTALIQVGSTICAVCRPVDLLATLIQVAFSGGHEDTSVILSEVKRQRNEVEESRCVAKKALLRDPSTSLRFARDNGHRSFRCNSSTSARASSVMLSNSGHGR